MQTSSLLISPPLSLFSLHLCHAVDPWNRFGWAAISMETLFTFPSTCIHTYCKTSKKFYINVRRGMRGSISIRQRESARPIGNSLSSPVLPPTALLIATRFSANFDPKKRGFCLDFDQKD